jgi:hypothetical protein
VQYATRAIRAGQLSVAAAYYFGAQAAASLRRAPPGFVQQMIDNPMLAIGCAQSAVLCPSRARV